MNPNLVVSLSTDKPKLSVLSQQQDECGIVQVHNVERKYDALKCQCSLMIIRFWACMFCVFYV